MLPREKPDLNARLHDVPHQPGVYLMRDRGMVLRLGAEVSRVRFGAGGSPICVLSDGREAASELALFTAGRNGATEALDLAACGLTADSRGRLSVDPATFRTAVPHIYAAGDVIGFPSLASTSMEQGRTAACHAFGEKPPEAVLLLPEPSQAVFDDDDCSIDNEAEVESPEAHQVS